MRISGMRCLIGVSLETIQTWCWRHVCMIVKEEAVPKRCQETSQIEIHHMKTGNLYSFGISKYKINVRKRYLNSMRVDVQ